ncbi:MAG: alpha/beta hydrolase [Isosphaeraceae bacterium]
MWRSALPWFVAAAVAGLGATGCATTKSGSLATRADPVASPRPQPSLVDSLLFRPAREPRGGGWEPDRPSTEVVWFPAVDGARLNGWFAEAERPRAVILYCEGNAGNVTSRRWVLDLFRDRMGASILLFDYRGYGRSEGVPSRDGILEDARAARRWLARRAGVSEREVVLVGSSLGGAVAVDLASRDGARGVVLESTFSSLDDLAGHHFGRLGRLVVPGDLDSASKIASYAGPLLQTHGDADRVVPYELGRRLHEAANEPKRFVRVEGGGHNDPPTPDYLAALDDFLGSLPVPHQPR